MSKNKPQRKEKGHPRPEHRHPTGATHKPGVKATCLSVGKAKAQLDEEKEKITKQYESSINRLGKSYAARWKEITNISTANAWQSVYTKINAILRKPDDEDTSALDIFLPSLTRIILERTTDHGMPTTLNLFSKVWTGGTDYPYSWKIMADERAIVIANGPQSWQPGVPLNTKEQKPLLKSMKFVLLDEDILDLYEAMAPYLKPSSP